MIWGSSHLVIVLEIIVLHCLISSVLATVAFVYFASFVVVGGGGGGVCCLFQVIG